MKFSKRNVSLNTGKVTNQGGEGDMADVEEWRWDNEIDEGAAGICCCQKDGKKYRIIGERTEKKGKNIVLLKEPSLKKQFEDAGITAEALLFEWENYYFDIVKNDKPEAETAEVFVGDVNLTRHSGLKKYPFQKATP
jgi:hypothetical protein